MSSVYIVRCNFVRADLEAQWHAWYGGPKMADMLSKPMFVSGQRFAAAAADQSIKYLALWVLESPEALETPEYTAQWGFADWTPHIADWSRNLYRAPDGGLSGAVEVTQGGGLYVAALDGVPAAEAESRRLALERERPKMLWMPVAGLDRSCPAIGLQAFAHLDRPPQLLPRELSAGVRETVYKPITAYRRATSTARPLA